MKKTAVLAACVLGAMACGADPGIEDVTFSQDVSSLQATVTYALTGDEPAIVFAEKTKPVADVNAAVDETAQEPLTELESEDPSDGSEDESMDVQYVMFVGTNDKDTNVPVCGREEAMTKVKQILIDHFGGYTVSDALGGWIGDDGMRYEEYTLMIFLSDTTLDEVHAAADELRELFDQSSILIQTYQTKTEFYSGE